MRIFSVDYQTGKQAEFERAFAEGDLELALEALNELLPPHTNSEEAKYNLARAEGFQALAKAYQECGKISYAQMENLKKYKKLGRPEVIQLQLDALARYVETGTLDEFRKSKGLKNESGIVKRKF